MKGEKNEINILTNEIEVFLKYISKNFEEEIMQKIPGTKLLVHSKNYSTKRAIS